MGLQDRSYYRAEEQPSSGSLPLPQTVVGWLVAINVMVYLADFLFGGRGHSLIVQLACTRESFSLVYFWQFLTAPFAHDPDNPLHLIFNMLGLWFFGRDLENRMGKREFVFFYLLSSFLAMLGAAGIYYALGRRFLLLGASGGVSAVVVLNIQFFPNRMLMLFPIPRPMPAWVFGLVFVGFDVLTAVVQQDTHGPRVAAEAHLLGAAWALAYGQGRFRLWPAGIGRWWRRWRSGLKVTAADSSFDDDVDEPPDSLPPAVPSLAKEADRILDKLHSQGESSLTVQERKTLEEYSRQLRRRRT